MDVNCYRTHFDERDIHRNKVIEEVAVYLENAWPENTLVHREVRDLKTSAKDIGMVDAKEMAKLVDKASVKDD